MPRSSATWVGIPRILPHRAAGQPPTARLGPPSFSVVGAPVERFRWRPEVRRGPALLRPPADRGPRAGWAVLVTAGGTLLVTVFRTVLVTDGGTAVVTVGGDDGRRLPRARLARMGRLRRRLAR